MTLKKYFVALLISIFLIGGCQQKQMTPKITDTSGSVQKDIQPSPEDIVNKQGNITNLEIFQTFLDNIKRGERDEIRIISYTKEGDPMIHKLIYDGEFIHSTEDTTRDQNGSGSINSLNCQSIEKEEKEENTDYYLSGCTNQSKGPLVLFIRN